MKKAKTGEVPLVGNRFPPNNILEKYYSAENYQQTIIGLPESLNNSNYFVEPSKITEILKRLKENDQKSEIKTKMALRGLEHLEGRRPENLNQDVKFETNFEQEG